jgi:uncharacterized phiE125 gp8 family phage protein
MPHRRSLPRRSALAKTVCLAVYLASSGLTQAQMGPDEGPTDGATQTLATNQYTVITSETGGKIVPAYNVTWPSVRWQYNAITVRMVVGWLAPEFPSDLRQAMLLLISHWYENRETVVIGQAPSALPMATEAILSGYKITRIL